MQLTITFRHMDASAAVRTYAGERLERIKKYVHGDPIAAHAIFSVERDHSFVAEFVITLPSGLVLQASETTEDMYSSIDLAGSRIERQVRKWKEKIRNHKPHGGPSFAMKGQVIEAAGLEPARGKASAKKVDKKAGKSGVPATTAPKAPALKVVKESTFTVRTMRIDDAVMQMNLMENDFFVFADMDSHEVSVVYRRKDGNYGLIETGAPATSS